MTSEIISRVVSFDKAWEDELCTHSEPFEWGRALFHSGFPDVYDLNFLRVERATPETSVSALADEAERIQGGAGLRHRKVRVAEETLGRSLEGGFKQLGWRPERTVVMAHRREPDRREEAGSAACIDLDEMRVARELSLRQDTEQKSESEIHQLVECARLVEERIGARFYGARAGDEIASSCELYSDGATAQIEAVITLEQHRNKGLARAVVLAALDDAVAEGHDLVFLVADDEDWPQELYRKLGFDPIGRPFCDFILTPTKLDS